MEVAGDHYAETAGRNHLGQGTRGSDRSPLLFCFGVWRDFGGGSWIQSSARLQRTCRVATGAPEVSGEMRESFAFWRHAWSLTIAGKSRGIALRLFSAWTDLPCTMTGQYRWTRRRVFEPCEQQSLERGGDVELDVAPVLRATRTGDGQFMPGHCDWLYMPPVHPRLLVRALPWLRPRAKDNSSSRRSDYLSLSSF